MANSNILWQMNNLLLYSLRIKQKFQNYNILER